MLTINADSDPVFRRFHKPEDETRSAVILPDDTWGDWLRRKLQGEAQRILRWRERTVLVTTRVDPM